jgi:hypothetical protein
MEGWKEGGAGRRACTYLVLVPVECLDLLELRHVPGDHLLVVAARVEPADLLVVLQHPDRALVPRERALARVLVGARPHLPQLDLALAVARVQHVAEQLEREDALLVPLEHRLAVQVGAAPLADRHVLRARVHVLIVVLQRLHPVGVRVEGRAAAQPLWHVLHCARRRGRGEQRVRLGRAHLVPSHVEHRERRRAPRERVRQLERVTVAPAVAKDHQVREAARGLREGLAQRLDGHRRVVAAPLPVDAAQLVLPDLELAQRVVLRAQPRADGVHRVG